MSATIFKRAKGSNISCPLRYDNWLAGEDYGCHPEEPNSKPSAAPRPSVEEFLQNNKDKLIPLCMLEPAGKKRRHPIHQKKKDNGEGKKRKVSFVSDENISFLCLQKPRQRRRRPRFGRRIV